jgi:hypothetical protein
VRVLVFAVLIVACGPGAKPSEPGPITAKQNGDVIKNAALGCGHIYEAKPGAYTVVLVDDRVVWINDTLKELNIAPIGGGDTVKFEIETRGQIHDAIVVGTNIIITDADGDAVRRISLADHKTTTLVEDLRHPYALAYAHGKFFIGGEDAFYRFDPATNDLTELHRGMALTLAAHGDTVYAALGNKLVALDARTSKENVLVTRPDRDLDTEFPALAATELGPVWSTLEGEIWTFDLATKRSRKLAKLAEAAVRIEPVGNDLYFAVGADVQRLRDGRLDTIPIDKRGWEEPDDPRIRIVAIGVRGDTLVYHAPYTAFASTCLQ